MLLAVLIDRPRSVRFDTQGERGAKDLERMGVFWSELFGCGKKHLRPSFYFRVVRAFREKRD